MTVAADGQRRFEGVGRRHGPLRPDAGPDHAELKCDECAASWVGAIDEPCPWCENALLALRDEARQRAEAAAREETRIYYIHPDDDQPNVGVEIVDWAELFAGITHEDPVVEGIAYAGRWTATAAPAKTGKSTLTMHLAVELQQGRDPIDHNPRDPIVVLYLDAEMGRVDVHERLDDLGLTPDDLALLHYSDLVPKLDTVEGSALLLAAVDQLKPAVVIIDGINGAVQGAEKDDTTWRCFYEWTIAPLKRQGIAVITNDNLGKDKTLGPRGSSVKVDKPDAIIQLERTDQGLLLKTTHRRTAAYPLEMHLTIEGADGSAPIKYRRSEGSWPAGTAGKAAELDRLGLPVNVSNRDARNALKQAGIPVGNSVVLAAAIRHRKRREMTGTPLGTVHDTSSGNSVGNTPPTPPSTRGEHFGEHSGTPTQAEREHGGCVPKEHPPGSAHQEPDLWEDF